MSEQGRQIYSAQITLENLNIDAHVARNVVCFKTRRRHGGENRAIEGSSGEKGRGWEVSRDKIFLFLSLCFFFSFLVFIILVHPMAQKLTLLFRGLNHEFSWFSNVWGKIAFLCAIFCFITFAPYKTIYYYFEKAVLEETIFYVVFIIL